MREILFRGKGTIDGEWKYGYYAGEVCKTPFSPTTKQDNIIQLGSNLWCEVVPDTVGQFTGLTDENGTKIFEGDVVRISEDYYDGLHYSGNEVYYSDGAFCVEYETPEYDVTSIGFLVREGVEVEVIGNIYDNPELIGGAENG